jgi:hypothetical protein
LRVKVSDFLEGKIPLSQNEIEDIQDDKEQKIYELVSKKSGFWNEVSDQGELDWSIFSSLEINVVSSIFQCFGVLDSDVEEIERLNTRIHWTFNIESLKNQHQKQNGEWFNDNAEDAYKEDLKVAQEVCDKLNGRIVE